jgi:hypothetical protein
MTGAEEAQQLVDDVLVVAEHLGFAWPPLVPAAAVTKALVDGGFALFFRHARAALEQQQAAAAAAGVTAAEAQAVTSAAERLRRICPECAEAIAVAIGRRTTTTGPAAPAAPLAPAR